MQTVLLVVHVLLALGLVGLVLIQHGKGADAGAAFGSGASATVFGARCATSFLTRVTAVLAALFFVNSLVLAYLNGTASRPEGLMEQVSQPPAASGLPQPEGGEGAESAAAAVEPPADAVPADVPVSDVPKLGE